MQKLTMSMCANRDYLEGYNRAVDDAAKDMDAIRARVAELENANVEQGAILEAITGALKGEEPSDFMRSFPDVEQAWWIYRLAYPTAK